MRSPSRVLDTKHTFQLKALARPAWGISHSSLQPLWVHNMRTFWKNVAPNVHPDLVFLLG